MSKKCINCNNVEIYKDNIVKCPVCGNYLKIVDAEIDNDFNNNYTIPGQEDPYSNYFDNSKNDNNSSNNDNKNNKDIFKGKSFIDFNTSDNDIKEVDNKSDKSNEVKEKANEIKDKTKKITQNKVEHSIEGIVKNFFEQEISTFFVTKVFRSLFRGLPFVLSNTVNTFQVYEGWGLSSGDNQIGTEVIIYGKIARGKLPENNQVKVWGKKDKHGSVIAKKIYNNTSQTYLKVNHSVNPIVIWILFLAFIYIVYQLTQVNWGQVFANILSFIMMIILVLVLLYFIIVFPIKSMFTKKDL